MRRAIWLLAAALLALPLAAREAPETGTETAPVVEEAPAPAMEEAGGLLRLDPPAFAVEEESGISMGKTPSGFEYVLYSDDEFQPWQRKLRRAEVLFFGGLPLTFALVGLVWSVFNIPEDFWTMLGISAGVSVCISLADLIVGETEASRDHETRR